MSLFLQNEGAPAPAAVTVSRSRPEEKHARARLMAGLNALSGTQRSRKIWGDRCRWTEPSRTASCLLSCLALLVVCSCSTPPQAETDAPGTFAAPTAKAAQLQNFIGRGTNVEITDKSGLIRMVHVTRIDNEVIVGETPEGQVSIPIADVGMARVQKGSSNGGMKPTQWDRKADHATAPDGGGFASSAGKGVLRGVLERMIMR